MTTNLKTHFHISIFLVLLLAVIAQSAISINSNSMPVTGAVSAIADQDLSGIAATMSQKGAGKVTRVTVPGKFSFAVVQSGSAVPNSGGTVGQYARAARKNNIGLLAHNYLAGGSFYTLSIGDEVQVTYSNGSTKTFVVSNVLRFQATDPSNYSKPFINVYNGKEVSAKSVFNKGYKSGQVTFQTCLWGEGSATWGLLFVQAKPKK